ncbi:uncharacterized protein LOC111916545 [Lactuca sativa]|uniref:uncharacterized protein LOC111916545 n=1 Tax=Lactuca sativa TaxID=4236 RepID=UPI000CD861A4|nr:uncharacterized protein LOC111916545 [Lactuca sativa]
MATWMLTSLPNFDSSKNEIKKWRAKDHPKETEELLKLKSRVQELDIAAENNSLSVLELQERRLGVQRIIELEKLAVLDLKEMARIRWTVDGDEDTRFFHGYVNNKKNKNHIHGLIINGSWNTDVAAIKGEVLSFYQKKFQEKWPSRPKLISSEFSMLDPASRSKIEEPFSTEEIKRAIWACGGDKAPGPDGFTFDFIKKIWDVLKGDIMEFIKYFEIYGTLERG